MNFRNNKTNKNQNNTAISPYYSWGLANRFEDIFDEFKRSFDQLMTPLVPFDPFGDVGMTTTQVTRAPFVDLIDEGDHYRVTAELPGFTKDTVDVQVSKNGLVLNAEKRTENEDKGENYLRRERGYAALERRLGFPEEVNPDKVEGTLNNGVLELRIPKLNTNPEEKPRRIQLK